MTHKACTHLRVSCEMCHDVQSADVVAMRKRMSILKALIDIKPEANTRVENTTFKS